MMITCAIDGRIEVANALQALHRDCHTVMAGMRAAIADDVYDGFRVPAIRHRMSQASTRRLRYLAEHVYPVALVNATPSQIEAIRELQGQATANRIRSSAHVAKWPSAAVAANWNDFRRDSRAIIKMMAERIEREEAVLLPILHQRRL